MKRLLLCLLIHPFIILAQQQPVIWHFGWEAGLNFSSGTPVPFNGSSMNQWEGCATACDTAGNLHFYTDGITVWDAANNVMPNGTGLMGNGSSTHSATIVPYPGHPEKYYLFTNTDIYSFLGFRYSIIDMTLNGGLGDITSVKNVLLLDSVTEHCVVIPANDGCTWVVTRKFDAEWYAYLVDSFGIQPPVISNVGTDCLQSQGQGVGYLKASPNHNKVALAKYGYIDSNSFFELYDFDNGTGVLSNPFELYLDVAVYSCEFSPDGDLFYGAEWANHLYQFDLTLGNPTDIANSKTLVGTTGNFTSIGALQIGPDQKVYAAIDNAPYLGVVNDPNTLGASCNFVENGVWLGGKATGIGLPPTLVFSSCLSNINVQAAFTSSDTTICEKFCLDFFDLSVNNPVSWEWFFDGADPSTSTDQDPFNICYDNPGTFDVTLITVGSNGVSDTLTLVDYITVYENPFAPVITQNGNVLTSSSALTYQWQLNSVDIPGATNQSLTITQTGLYTVIITNENGCQAQSSIDASYVGMNDLPGEGIVLFPNPSDGYFTIQLLNGTGGQLTITVTNTLGQIIYSSQENISSLDWKKNIDLRAEAGGTYFVTVQTERSVLNWRLVIR